MAADSAPPSRPRSAESAPALSSSIPTVPASQHLLPLLEVQDLQVSYPRQNSAGSKPGGRRFFNFKRELFQAVKGVSFQIAEKETVGLVGESGCGKSSIGRAIVRLLKPSGGKIIFAGEDLARMEGGALRRRRRELQMIFQDPYSSLDPRISIGESVGEALDIHQLSSSTAARKERISDLLKLVGLDPEAANRYPHEFSGGQRQRIGIARALAVKPRLVVCDEPVSALDVSIQAQIINLLADLQDQQGLSYLFIAHDLAVVEHISHRILVMYLGKIVEQGPARELCRMPLHPYTATLLSSVPQSRAGSARQRIVLQGEIPSPANPPGGCPFHTRCPMAVLPRCGAEAPALRQITPGHWSACHFAEETPAKLLQAKAGEAKSFS